MYWVAWVILAVAALHAEAQELMSPVPPELVSLLVELQLVAAIALLCGSIIFRNVRFRAGAEDDPGKYLKLCRSLVIVMATVGAIHLIERLITVGFNLAEVFYNLRISFIEENLTPLGKISAYFSTGGPVVAIIYARHDRVHGIDLKRIAYLVAALGLHGIALGGRGFLAGPVIVYALAFLTAPRPSVVPPLPPLRIVFSYLMISLLAFVILGEWRFGKTAAHQNSESSMIVRAIDAPAVWIGTSLVSCEPAMHAMNDLDTNGRLIFEWPALQLERIGLFEIETKTINMEIRQSIMTELPEAINYPPTILPYLVGDFGARNLHVSVFLMLFIVQGFSLMLTSRVMLQHTLLVFLLTGTFYTIQSNMFFTAGNCLGLLWLAILGGLARGSLRSSRGDRVQRVSYGPKERLV